MDGFPRVFILLGAAEICNKKGGRLTPRILSNDNDRLWRMLETVLLIVALGVVGAEVLLYPVALEVVDIL